MGIVQKLPFPASSLPRCRAELVAQRRQGTFFSLPSPHPLLLYNDAAVLTFYHCTHSITLHASSEQRGSPPAPPEMTHPCTTMSEFLIHLFRFRAAKRLCEPGRHRETFCTLALALTGVLARTFLQECPERRGSTNTCDGCRHSKDGEVQPQDMRAESSHVEKQ